MIRFRLSAPTPSLNETLRWHWSVKRKRQKAVAEEAYVQFPKAWRAFYGMQPIARARVHIIRHGSRLLDEDNLVGGVKGLVDVLKPPGKSSPYSLGIIAGDEPDKLVLSVAQVKCKRVDACTWVEVEDMGE